jgi:hypothetical protein
MESLVVGFERDRYPNEAASRLITRQMNLSLVQSVRQAMPLSRCQGLEVGYHQF